MLEAADCYDSERHGFGTAFVDEVERTLRQVAVHPEASPVELGNIRKCVVARFPYSVMYSAEAGGVLVTAIAHHSRRPTYWRSRL